MTYFKYKQINKFWSTSIKIVASQDMKMEAAYFAEMLVPSNCQTIHDVMSQNVIILTGFKFLRSSNCVEESCIFSG